jgi:uncharacterized membrane protein
MELMIVDVISRIGHVGAAIVLLGGAVFSRFVLLPSAADLPDLDHDKLRAGVLGRWKKVVHGGIALLLLTGFYNFFRALPGHKGQPLYHSLIGTKIILAFGIFFIASALVGRSSAATAMRKHAKFWVGVIVLFGAMIVAISGYAKVALVSQPPPLATPLFDAE